MCTCLQVREQLGDARNELVLGLPLTVNDLYMVTRSAHDCRSAHLQVGTTHVLDTLVDKVEARRLLRSAAVQVVDVAEVAQNRIALQSLAQHSTAHVMHGTWTIWKPLSYSTGNCPKCSDSLYGAMP